MYDIIAVGATGYTGKFVAKHLAERQDAEHVSWAIAGRNTEKLEKLKRDLDLDHDVGIITADSTKPKGADLLAKEAKVIITTVGPYSLYGEELVRACAESGTHLIDITGEMLWIDNMIQRYEGTTKKSGAKLVNCCGFVSVPADVGAYMAWKYFNDQYGPETKFTDFRCVFLDLTTPSGGTIASTLEAMRTVWEGGRKDMERMNDKYLLLPRKNGGTANTDSRPVQNASLFEDVVLPFNVRYCGFQCSLLDDKKDPYYGLHFSELSMATLFPTVRNFLTKFLKQRGQGVSDEACVNKGTRVDVVATGQTKEGKIVKAFGQIGCLSEEMCYRGTGRMMCEMAFSLLDVKESGEEGNGGFHTPASAGRETFLNRLRDQGFIFRMGNEKLQWPSMKGDVQKGETKKAK